MAFNKKVIISLLLSLLIIFTMSVMAALGGSQVENTVHNLSTSGSGDITASSENRICVFCHTPHNANPAKPLWNHATSNADYQKYYSSTMNTTSTSMKSLSGSPTKLCLSCHDGTIAMGDLANMNVIMKDSTKLANDESFADTANANLGIDLSDDHPVLFEPGTSDLEINRLEDGIDLYDNEGYLQCTTCHEPHDNTYGDFLVMDNTDSALCTTCHNKTGWSVSAHDQYLSCEDCHTPHNANEPVRLKAASEEDLCYNNCHDGNWGGSGTPPDIKTVIDNAKGSGGSTHPVDDAELADRHDALENNDPDNEQPLAVEDKHSECSDCHDPHQVTADNPLKGVPGFGLDGTSVSSVTSSNQLCYKCHQGIQGWQESINSVKYVYDNRTSLHGNSSNNAGKCSKCHGGNDLDVVGGIHSSSVPGLLKKPQFADINNPTTSDLCLKCHDSNTNGGQPKIYFTLATSSQHNTKCTACHGDSVNHSNGINVGSETGVPHGSNVSSLLKDSRPNLCKDCHSWTRHSHNCSSCHTPHGSDVFSLLQQAPTLDGSALCTDCHAIGYDYGVYGHQNHKCLDCHTAHQSPVKCVDCHPDYQDAHEYYGEPRDPGGDCVDCHSHY